MNRIRDYVHEGDIDSAFNLCKRTDTPYARLIQKGLSRIGRPMNDVLVAIENTGNIEVAQLGKGFPWLSTTAAGAPMLGFLGTVVGMIQAFFSLASAGTSANITVLSSGIYQALVTTVAGLVVGIIALFAYNYLVARVNRVMNFLSPSHRTQRILLLYGCQAHGKLIERDFYGRGQCLSGIVAVLDKIYCLVCIYIDLCHRFQRSLFAALRKIDIDCCREYDCRGHHEKYEQKENHMKSRSMSLPCA